jgi:hypothetical protein
MQKAFFYYDAAAAMSVACQIIPPGIYVIVLSKFLF